MVIIPVNREYLSTNLQEKAFINLTLYPTGNPYAIQSSDLLGIYHSGITGLIPAGTDICKNT